MNGEGKKGKREEKKVEGEGKKREDELELAKWLLPASGKGERDIHEQLRLQGREREEKCECEHGSPHTQERLCQRVWVTILTNADGCAPTIRIQICKLCRIWCAWQLYGNI